MCVYLSVFALRSSACDPGQEVRAALSAQCGEGEWGSDAVQLMHCLSLYSGQETTRICALLGKCWKSIRGTQEFIWRVWARFRACCGSAAVFLRCNYKTCKHGYDNGTAGRPHPVSVGVSLQMLLQETEKEWDRDALAISASLSSLNNQFIVLFYSCWIPLLISELE